jgi:iron complex outermembrane receptor protein
VPITDSFQAQLAARYEDYGGAVGSTFNPKASVRWQALPWMAVRASAGSTFRGPPDPLTTSTSVTSLQGILGVFRAVDIFGNQNLQPEKANTYNLGLLFKAGNFKASVDYFQFDFKNPIVAEPVAGMVAALYPNGAAGANNCANPAYAGLVARFTYNGGCSTPTTSIARLKTNYINGAAVKNSGLDFSADYRFDDVLGGELAVGGNATYIQEYQVGATTVEGVVVEKAFDAVGLLNYQTTVVPIPQWKGDVYAEWNRGPHNLRVTVHYIDSYTDQRTAPFLANYKDTTGALVTVAAGKQIDAQTLTDLAYRVFLPWDTTLTAAITNVFDKDPSYARLDLGYDPFTGDPLGRTYKVGIRKKF